MSKLTRNLWIAIGIWALVSIATVVIATVVFYFELWNAFYFFTHFGIIGCGIAGLIIAGVTLVALFKDRPRAVVFLLITFLILAFYILVTLTDVDFVERSDKENAARILQWNLRRCGEISRSGREYGEGTLTITCTTGDAYLLSSYEHCDNPLLVYCWEVEDLAPDTLERK